MEQNEPVPTDSPTNSLLLRQGFCCFSLWPLLYKGVVVELRVALLLNVRNYIAVRLATLPIKKWEPTAFRSLRRTIPMITTLDLRRSHICKGVARNPPISP
jgi:hypothetical protein